MGARVHGVADWVSAGSALVLLGAAEASLRVVPFRRLMSALRLRVDPTRAAGPPPSREVRRDDPEVEVALRRVTWAVDAAVRRTPWTSKCLAQALAGAVLLRAHRRAATVWFGVRPPGPNRPMTAHAWLVSGDLVLTGAAGRHDYGVVAVYASPPTRPQLS